jgi:hypothetical protein
LTFRAPAPYKRAVIRALGWLVPLALVLASGAPGSESEVRRAVEGLVARLAGPRIEDLVIEQTLTLYHPDGRHPRSTGERILYLKPPRRQRIEQTIDRQREVRLTVGNRTWVRQPDGEVREVPADARGRSDLFSPLRSTADDLLAEWRSFGVRQEVSHVVQLGGRPVLVVGAAPGDRKSPAVWLDETYGVVRVVTRERLPQGPTLVDVALSEHRPVLDGFYFPYRQEVFAEGRLLLRFVVRAVRVNPGLPEALFDPAVLRRAR